jgi:hypothetical protein
MPMNRTLALPPAARPAGCHRVARRRRAWQACGACPLLTREAAIASARVDFSPDARTASPQASFEDRGLDPRRQPIDQGRGLLEHCEVGLLGP